MIRLVIPMWKKAGMSDADFHARWLGEHGKLVASLAADLQLARYVQSHKTDVPEIEAFAQARGWSPSCDGVAELWWTDIETMRAAFATEAGQRASAILAEDEARFCATEKMSAFVVDEHEFISPK